MSQDVYASRPPEATGYALASAALAVARIATGPPRASLGSGARGSAAVFCPRTGCGSWFRVASGHFL